MDNAKQRLTHRLATSSLVAGAVTVFVGGAVLAGWALDVALLKSVLPGLMTMKANTAVCFVLAGASLLLWHRTHTAPSATPDSVTAKYAGLALAALAVAVAVVTLSEDLFNWNAGIDEILFHETPLPVEGSSPGRMSAAVALSFVLVGVSEMLLFFDSERAAGTAQALAAVTAAIAAISLLGYLLHIPALYKVRAFSATALHTAVTFLVLQTGLLAARPARGWMKELVADTPGAQMGRRLLVAVLILLPALGWLRLEGQDAGWYGTEFGIAVQIVASLFLIVVLIWLNTFLANRAEAKILRLSRVHMVLSKINALIVRVHDAKELFAESCRIAVDAGGFRFAWLGVVERGAVRPVAWAGDERALLPGGGHAYPMRNSAGERGPVAEAVRTGKPAIANDIRTAANMPEAKGLLERGIRSLAILPIVVGGEARGVIALHTGAAGFFDEEEIKLFMELAGDVAFALDHIEKEQQLDYLAYYDTLTALANRTLFRDRLMQHMSGVERERGKFALVLFDIERFKMINDTFGRNAGDELLRQIAQRLERYASERSRLARIGSDQFAVLVPELQVESDVARLHEHMLQECFSRPFPIGGEAFRVSARAGIAIYPADGADADTLFNNAEAALKKTKAAGERYLFYGRQMNEAVAEKLRLESGLREALEKNQFVLHYQPKVNVETRKIKGVEALIRWQSPGLGLVPPMRFIPLMEETGMILEVGAWALRQAVLDSGRLADKGTPAPRIAVNVSSIQLRRQNFVETLEDALDQNAAAHGLDLEITESVIMENIEANVRKLRAVRTLGVSIAIDDFGTGYSSLAYLAKLPVQTLKIDRSFIATMLSEPETKMLVATIVSLAHSLGLQVVAEGVESEMQARALQTLGCDEMQGYFICQPLPFEELLSFIKQAGS